MIQFKSIAFIFIEFINRANFHKSTSFCFFQNVHYQNFSALHFLTKSFQISFQCFHCHRIFNKSSTANYFLTCRLNNQSWIKSICNYQIAKVEISIKSKSVKFFIFKFYHWQLRHQEQQLIYSPFLKNHTNFCFVRLTFRLAALDSRASYAEFHPSASYIVG